MIMRAILAILAAKAVRILLAAPTGRAAKRMSTGASPCGPFRSPGTCLAAGLIRAVQRQARQAVTAGARAVGNYAATRLRARQPERAPVSEGTGFEARTIHRLLEVDPRTGAFRRGPDHLLECDLLVIDEASGST